MRFFSFIIECSSGILGGFGLSFKALSCLASSGSGGIHLRTFSRIYDEIWPSYDQNFLRARVVILIFRLGARRLGSGGL